MYKCMYATAALCSFVLHLLVSRPLPVLVCLPAVRLVDRCPGRVKPLLVPDCRPAALLVARPSLSDRYSCSQDHPPLLTARLPLF